MGVLEQSQNFVYSVMDKLGPIREYLIQRDDQWEEWGLQDLVDNLERYVERNPIQTKRDGHRYGERDIRRDGGRDKRRHELGMMGNSHQKCIYCSSVEHNSHKCDKVLDIAARKQILVKSRACFNIDKSRSV